ncbi:MAG TPA: CdaR family protein [Candidatus Limnocylindria bacterium]|nr:CdaR family protein [Candidatus Limnocylindria bacterium]
MGWIFRNWHLKLSAVLLATVLYTGLVFSGSFSESTIQVRIGQENASSDVFVLTGDLGLVEVTYRTARDTQQTVVADSFSARVDLADYDMDRAPEPQELPITVTAADGIQILSIDPKFVRVSLDRVETRTVPVVVDPGSVPDGLRIGDPAVDPTEVQVRGPSSVVSLVDRVVAYVTIPASGIDFNEPVNPKPVDVEGQPVGVGLLEVQPESVSVTIDVSQVETTDTITVRPVIEGTPAPGFALEAISVDPSTVTLRGLPEDLEPITEVLTEPISIAGLSADDTIDVDLVVPETVELVDGTAGSVTVSVTIVPSVSSRVFVLGVVCSGAGANACLPGLDQVSVTVTGPGQVLSGLTAAQLTPTLNVAGLAPGSYTINPTIAGLPEGVELLGISPPTVPVQIVAPATPTPAPTPAP